MCHRMRPGKNSLNRTHMPVANRKLYVGWWPIFTDESYIAHTLRRFWQIQLHVGIWNELCIRSVFRCIRYTVCWVTGQLADTPTRGLPSRGLDNSRSRRCRQKGKISTQSRRWHLRIVQSASWQSASWRIRELSSNPNNSVSGGRMSEEL